MINDKEQTIKCECGGSMSKIFDKRVDKVKSKGDEKNKRKIRCRKFKCEVCENVSTIFGAGAYDLNPELWYEGLEEKKQKYE